MQRDELLTTSEVAQRLHVTRRTLIRWRGERRGPVWLRVGTRVLYPSSKLDQRLDSRVIEPVAEEGAD